MGRVLHLRGDPHKETERLLPWYVVDALDSADRLLVDTHLADCAGCRAALADERRLCTAVADLPATGDQAWERLAATRKFADTPAPRIRAPHRAAWVVAAQVAAAVLVTSAWFAYRQADTPAARYRALGDAATVQRSNLLVMFRADARREDVRRVLAASHARLVDGPTAAGAYLLAVAPADRAATLDRLRRQPEVTLVQPIDAAPPT